MAAVSNGSGKRQAAPGEGPAPLSFDSVFGWKSAASAKRIQEVVAKCNVAQAPRHADNVLARRRALRDRDSMLACDAVFSAAQALHKEAPSGAFRGNLANGKRRHHTHSRTGSLSWLDASSTDSLSDGWDAHGRSPDLDTSMLKARGLTRHILGRSDGASGMTAEAERLSLADAGSNSKKSLTAARARRGKTLAEHRDALTELRAPPPPPSDEEDEEEGEEGQGVDPLAAVEPAAPSSLVPLVLGVHAVQAGLTAPVSTSAAPFTCAGDVVTAEGDQAASLSWVDSLTGGDRALNAVRSMYRALAGLQAERRLEAKRQAWVAACGGHAVPPGRLPPGLDPTLGGRVTLLYQPISARLAVAVRQWEETSAPAAPRRAALQAHRAQAVHVRQLRNAAKAQVYDRAVAGAAEARRAAAAPALSAAGLDSLGFDITAPQPIGALPAVMAAVEVCIAASAAAAGCSGSPTTAAEASAAALQDCIQRVPSSGVWGRGVAGVWGEAPAADSVQAKEAVGTALLQAAQAAGSAGLPAGPGGLPLLALPPGTPADVPNVPVQALPATPPPTPPAPSVVVTKPPPAHHTQQAQQASGISLQRFVWAQAGVPAPAADTNVAAVLTSAELAVLMASVHVQSQGAWAPDGPFLCPSCLRDGLSPTPRGLCKACTRLYRFAETAVDLCCANSELAKLAHEAGGSLGREAAAGLQGKQFKLLANALGVPVLSGPVAPSVVLAKAGVTLVEGLPFDDLLPGEGAPEARQPLASLPPLPRFEPPARGTGKVPPAAKAVAQAWMRTVKDGGVFVAEEGTVPLEQAHAAAERALAVSAEHLAADAAAAKWTAWLCLPLAAPSELPVRGETPHPMAVQPVGRLVPTVAAGAWLRRDRLRKCLAFAQTTARASHADPAALPAAVRERVAGVAGEGGAAHAAALACRLLRQTLNATPGSLLRGLPSQATAAGVAGSIAALQWAGLPGPHLLVVPPPQAVLWQAVLKGVAPRHTVQLHTGSPAHLAAQQAAWLPRSGGPGPAPRLVVVVPYPAFHHSKAALVQSAWATVFVAGAGAPTVAMGLPPATAALMPQVSQIPCITRTLLLATPAQAAVNHTDLVHAATAPEAATAAGGPKAGTASVGKDGGGGEGAERLALPHTVSELSGALHHPEGTPLPLLDWVAPLSTDPGVALPPALFTSGGSATIPPGASRAALSTTLEAVGPPPPALAAQLGGLTLALQLKGHAPPPAVDVLAAEAAVLEGLQWSVQSLAQVGREAPAALAAASAPPPAPPTATAPSAPSPGMEGVLATADVDSLGGEMEALVGEEAAPCVGMVPDAVLCAAIVDSAALVLCHAFTRRKARLGGQGRGTATWATLRGDGLLSLDTPWTRPARELPLPARLGLVLLQAASWAAPDQAPAGPFAPHTAWPLPHPTLEGKAILPAGLLLHPAAQLVFGSRRLHTSDALLMTTLYTLTPPAVLSAPALKAALSVSAAPAGGRKKRSRERYTRWGDPTCPHEWTRQTGSLKKRYTRCVDCGRRYDPLARTWKVVDSRPSTSRKKRRGDGAADVGGAGNGGADEEEQEGGDEEEEEEEGDVLSVLRRGDGSTGTAAAPTPADVPLPGTLSVPEATRQTLGVLHDRALRQLRAGGGSALADAPPGPAPGGGKGLMAPPSTPAPSPNPAAPPTGQAGEEPPKMSADDVLAAVVAETGMPTVPPGLTLAKAKAQAGREERLSLALLHAVQRCAPVHPPAAARSLALRLKISRFLPSTVMPVSFLKRVAAGDVAGVLREVSGAWVRPVMRTQVRHGAAFVLGRIGSSVRQHMAAQGLPVVVGSGYGAVDCAMSTSRRVSRVHAAITQTSSPKASAKGMPGALPGVSLAGMGAGMPTFTLRAFGLRPTYVDGVAVSCRRPSFRQQALRGADGSSTSGRGGGRITSAGRIMGRAATDDTAAVPLRHGSVLVAGDCAMVFLVAMPEHARDILSQLEAGV